MSEDLDSLRAAARIIQSSRLRTVLVMLWPYLLAGTSFASAWVIKSIQTDGQFAEVRLAQQRAEEKAERRHQEAMAVQETAQRRVLAIGKQAAFATAAAQAGETTKVKTTKALFGAKYAAAYERMVAREGLDPETAYTYLTEVSAP